MTATTEQAGSPDRRWPGQDGAGAHRTRNDVPVRRAGLRASSGCGRVLAGVVRHAGADLLLGARVWAGRYLDWVTAAHLRVDRRRDKGPVPQYHDKLREAVRRNTVISLAGLITTGVVVAGDLLIVET